MFFEDSIFYHWHLSTSKFLIYRHIHIYRSVQKVSSYLIFLKNTAFLEKWHPYPLLIIPLLIFYNNLLSSLQGLPSAASSYSLLIQFEIFFSLAVLTFGKARTYKEVYLNYRESDSQVWCFSKKHRFNGDSVLLTQ